jgi:thiamine pyrophosphokinase
MNALVKHAAQAVVLVGGDDLCFLCPPELALDLAPGTRVSLFPMGPVQGASEGLRWPIAGLAFSPDARIGTSNLALGPVRLAFDAPRMLLILPEALLGQVALRLRAGNKT